MQMCIFFTVDDSTKRMQKPSDSKHNECQIKTDRLI